MDILSHPYTIFLVFAGLTLFLQVKNGLFKAPVCRWKDPSQASRSWLALQPGAGAVTKHGIRMDQKIWDFTTFHGLNQTKIWNDMDFFQESQHFHQQRAKHQHLVITWFSLLILAIRPTAGAPQRIFAPERCSRGIGVPRAAGGGGTARFLLSREVASLWLQHTYIVI